MGYTGAVTDYLVRMRYDVPSLEIREKGNWRRWWHKAIPVFMTLVGLVAPKFEDWFYENTVTTLGDTIYLPLGHDDGVKYFSKNFQRYGLLRHEAVHLRDWFANPVWFPFSYTLVLPAVWTTRFKWELRGYAQNMIVEMEETGFVQYATVNWICDNLGTSAYLWAHTSPRRIIESIRDQILDKKISGEYPDFEITKET